MSILPVAASTLAPQVDRVMLAVLAFCIFILLLVCGLILFFGIRYREGSTASRKAPPKKGMLLELAWTGALIGISLALFAWGAWVYFQQHQVPEGATDIFVVSKQWMWKFQHADGKAELGELHVPTGQKIRLVMVSEDVIHSLYIPAFRMKQDVLPDRYTYQWFEATRPGEYPIFCAEFCGTQHSGMGARLIVMKAEEYSRWQAGGISSATPLSAETLVTRGAEHFRRLGCISCHSAPEAQQPAPGATPLAPALGGVYGSQVGLRTGAAVFADENYLRESILNPSAKIVMGYSDIMPSFQGKVSEEELVELVAFIKSQGSSR